VKGKLAHQPTQGITENYYVENCVFRKNWVLEKISMGKAFWKILSRENKK
jgi:hypothetical protein